jgi:hypothetical protein
MCVHRLLGVIVPALALALLFPGCYWSQNVLEGNAQVEMEVPCSDIGRVLSVTTRLMDTNGYHPAADATDQEIPFVVVHPHRFVDRVICFVHGGRDRVWIIAQPSAYGWHLFCLPEPEGYDTSFARRKFRQVLESVRQECVNPAKRES